jgi:hypothetical protein
MGKKNTPSPSREIYPAYPDVIGSSANAAFTVYEIQNGYLLRPEVQAGPQGLVFCKDIQDLTEQILSSQAQLRLGLSSAKINKY